MSSLMQENNKIANVTLLWFVAGWFIWPLARPILTEVFR